MYEKHFGLKMPPFNTSPDPQFLYPSRQHQEALARLGYAIATRKGVMTLIGEPGTGKTTICTTLLKGLNESTISAWVFNTSLNHVSLLKYICRDFGLEVKSNDYGQILMTLYRFLIRNYENKRNAVIVIDEAQNLSVQALEEIRQLSNLETVRRKLVQIILAGQPRLNKVLENPNLKQLRQRISINARLRRLNKNEAIEYVLHRLQVAGAGEMVIFQPEVMDYLYELSEGIPRLLNTYCDNAMLSAFRRKKKIVDLDVLKQTVNGKMVGYPGSPQSLVDYIQPQVHQSEKEYKSVPVTNQSFDEPDGNDMMFSGVDLSRLSLN